MVRLQRCEGMRDFYGEIAEVWRDEVLLCCGCGGMSYCYGVVAEI